jgi:hypothetical protein
MRRLISFPACVLVLSVASALPASAQGNDGTWKGQITCAKLSFTKGTQKVPMTMTVAGDKATYERQVWNPDKTAVVGTEAGSGTVDASGAIKLSATWKGVKENPRWTYTASYSGAIKGKSANLARATLEERRRQVRRPQVHHRAAALAARVITPDQRPCGAGLRDFAALVEHIDLQRDDAAIRRAGFALVEHGEDR